MEVELFFAQLPTIRNNTPLGGFTTRISRKGVLQKWRQYDCGSPEISYLKETYFIRTNG